MKVINHPETVKKCRLINKSELGRLIGESASIVQQVSAGTYRSMKSDRALKILSELRQRGLLVEEDVEEHTA